MTNEDELWAMEERFWTEGADSARHMTAKDAAFVFPYPAAILQVRSHLAMDTATSDIRAVEFTPSSAGDSPILPELLDQIPEVEEIGTVTADGAYDTRRCHTAIIDRQATSIIPIRKNGLTGWSICKRRSFVDGHVKISGRFDHVKPSRAAF